MGIVDCWSAMLVQRVPYGKRGLRHVLRAEPDRVQRVVVDDPGVIQGVNTPGEYRRLTGQAGG